MVVGLKLKGLSRIAYIADYGDKDVFSPKYIFVQYPLVTFQKCGEIIGGRENKNNLVPKTVFSARLCHFVGSRAEPRDKGWLGRVRLSLEACLFFSPCVCYVLPLRYSNTVIRGMNDVVIVQPPYRTHAIKDDTARPRRVRLEN